MLKHTLSTTDITALLEGAPLVLPLGIGYPIELSYRPEALTLNLPTVQEETVEEVMEHAAALGISSASPQHPKAYPLLAAGYLKVNEILFYSVSNHSFGIQVNADGEFMTTDGRSYAYPTPAAAHARELETGNYVPTVDGWHVLRNTEGISIGVMREESGLWQAQENTARTSYRLREDWAELAVKLRVNQTH